VGFFPCGSQIMDVDSPHVQPPQLDDFEDPIHTDLELPVDASNPSVSGILSKATSAKWPASFGTSIDSLKSRWTATKDHYQARKEEVQQAALERGRQIRNATKSAMLDVKEQYQEKRNDLVQKVVNGLEATEETEQYKPPELQVVEVTQRWWTAACAAAHHPHKIAEDPPEPPERALAPLEGPATDQVSGTGGTGTDATSHREALGCLEVELLHFSNEPPLTCHDGNVAASPVCQLALGGRCTGALRPRPAGGSASVGSPLSGSSRQVGASAELTEVKHEPSAAALGEQSPPSEEGRRVRQKPDLEREVSSARFLVDEIVGCDLRVHVFDGDSKKFSFGSEDRAFCGGAFVPLSSIVRHHAGLGGPISGLLCQTFEAELAVKLLPLDAVRMARKLQKAETTGLERPSVTGGLGYVVLRLRLTVYDWVPAWMYTKLPYRGQHAEVYLDGAQVDNPMSILKAMGKSMERLSRALNPRIFLDAMERLQERAATAVLIHALWAYTCLWAPVWKVPGCVVAAIVILAAEVSCVNKEVAESPRLYREELGDDVADLSRMERTKHKVHQAVKMELRMMKFASAVTKVAIVAEKVRYILTLQDPKLSVLILALLCCCLAGATAALRVAAAVFGRQASFVFAWAGGCVLLLPARGRDGCRQLVQRLIAEKERRLGRGRLKPMVLALWRRIPDGLEAQHCELAESYVLRSEGAEG